MKTKLAVCLCLSIKHVEVLKYWSGKKGLSFSEFIRQILDDYLERLEADLVAKHGQPTEMEF